jgi:nucleotide-binding universal stress UspA family protein
MYKHILIATDGSELATKALEHGLALAKRDGSQVTVVTVTEPWSTFDMAQAIRKGQPNPIEKFTAIATKVAKRILDDAAQQANALGVRCNYVHMTAGYPAEGIISAANERKCDLIVMGSRGLRGISRLLLGSQAYEVLTHCHVPALVVR